jgi:hypothetical protein
LRLAREVSADADYLFFFFAAFFAGFFAAFFLAFMIGVLPL